jgi:L-rhamnose mutarotase
LLLDCLLYDSLKISTSITQIQSIYQQLHNQIYQDILKRIHVINHNQSVVIENYDKKLLSVCIIMTLCGWQIQSDNNTNSENESNTNKNQKHACNNSEIDNSIHQSNETNPEVVFHCVLCKRKWGISPSTTSAAIDPLKQHRSHCPWLTYCIPLERDLASTRFNGCQMASLTPSKPSPQGYEMECGWKATLKTLLSTCLGTEVRYIKTTSM